MKFAVSVVLFALALGAAHCSVIPLITSINGAVLAAPQASIAVHAAAVPAALPTLVAAPAPIQVITSPVVAPAVVAVAPAAGTYVAKTRGALHVAPLPGHLQSAASVNLEPAPGTH